MPNRSSRSNNGIAWRHSVYTFTIQSNASSFGRSLYFLYLHLTKTPYTHQQEKNLNGRDITSGRLFVKTI